MQESHLKKVAEDIYQLSVLAGQAILPYYHEEKDIQIAYKADDSPLTEADKASHQVIFAFLKDYRINHETIPILSEEGDEQSLEEKRGWRRYWCIDPLDGTKEFIHGQKEFTVNIALIEDHQPIVGVIYAPVIREGYVAWRNGGAYAVTEKGWQPTQVRRPPNQTLRVIVSRRHGIAEVEQLLGKLPDYKRFNRGSALKFCEIAKGAADLFLRTTETCEWDNAAGQCIVEEAGGRLFHFDQTPVSYNNTLSMKTKPIVVVGDPEYPWEHYL